MPPDDTHAGRYLRRRSGRHKYTTTMHSDCYVALKRFAADHGVTVSGAIHELIRTHPSIGLPSILFSDRTEIPLQQEPPT